MQAALVQVRRTQELVDIPDRSPPCEYGPAPITTLPRPSVHLEHMVQNRWLGASGSMCIYEPGFRASLTHLSAAPCSMAIAPLAPLEHQGYAPSQPFFPGSRCTPLTDSSCCMPALALAPCGYLLRCRQFHAECSHGQAFG